MPASHPPPQAAQSVGQLVSVSSGGVQQPSPHFSGQSAGQLQLVSVPVQQKSPQDSGQGPGFSTQWQ